MLVKNTRARQKQSLRLALVVFRWAALEQWLREFDFSSIIGILTGKSCRFISTYSPVNASFLPLAISASILGFNIRFQFAAAAKSQHRQKFAVNLGAIHSSQDLDQVEGAIGLGNMDTFVRVLCFGVMLWFCEWKNPLTVRFVTAKTANFL